MAQAEEIQAATAADTQADSTTTEEVVATAEKGAGAPASEEKDPKAFADVIERRKNDLDSLLTFAERQNNKAKEYQDKYEALMAQIEAQKAEATAKEQTELEKLQNEIKARDEKIQALQSDLQSKAEKEIQKEFLATVGNHGGDADFVEFMLEKHFKQIAPEDRETEMDLFDLDKFIVSLKKSHPTQFSKKEADSEEPAAAVKANSGFKPEDVQPQQKKEQLDKIAPKSNSLKDRKEFEANWDSWKAARAQRRVQKK